MVECSIEIIKVILLEGYENSSICQKCANCCKQFWIYVYKKEEALRFAWLERDIFVIKIREGLWKIIFDIPCIMLEERDGLYYCKRHKGERPDFCRTYPTNFKDQEKDIIDIEKKVCPLIKVLENE